MRHALTTFFVILGTLIAYLTASFIAGMLFEIYYYLRYGGEAPPGGMEAYIVPSISLLLIFASLITLGIFWTVYRLRGKSMIKSLHIKGIKFRHGVKSIAIGALFSLFLFSLMSLTRVYRLFPSHGEVIDSLVPEGGNFSLVFLSVAIVVPVFEEVMHRGIIYQQLKKRGPLPMAIVFQALIFGVFHLNWLQGIYAFVGGIILALLYEYTKTLWAPILMHIGWNATSLFIPPVEAEWILAVMMILSLAGVGIVFTRLKKDRVYEIWISCKGEDKA